MFPESTRILIADDMMTMRKIVRSCLRNIGLLNVTEAPDGQAAWQLLEASVENGMPFDLVVSDWNMPTMSGLDLLKKVRSHPKTGKVPFILLTAEGEKSQVEEAVRAGASGYILKPFTPAGLSEKLAAVHATIRKA